MVAGKRLLDDEGNEMNPKRHNTGSQPLLKLLVPNYVAGALIGKGGSLITEMKEKFGGNIRLSANGEVYPGTDERIVVLSGEDSEIIELNTCIMDKVQNGTSKMPIDEQRREKIKIVLTNAAAGLLIGRGGATIKAIQEDTKARISICNTDVAAVSGERVLTMSGTEEQRAEASRQIIEKISSDSSNMANTQLKYGNNMAVNMAQGSGSGPYLGSMQPRSMQPNSMQTNSMQSNSMQTSSMQAERRNLYSNVPVNPISALRGAAASSIGLSNQQGGRSKLKTKVEIQMEVPDALVGPILGKQGQIIREFAQRSGARLKFSDKNEFAAGTTDRILTITGNMSQTQAAYTLINERVEEAGNQLNSRSF